MEISNYSPGGSVVISEEAISSIATNAAKDSERCCRVFQ